MKFSRNQIAGAVIVLGLILAFSAAQLWLN